MAKDLKRRIVAEFSAKNKAKGVMSGFRRDMDTTGRALRRMAVGALAVAGIGGVGYMLKKQMETIDATAKLSDRLGVTTEKLIGLQHAASITGTDAETLNKSLEIFTRRLGEMTQGSGEAKRGLDMLGLTAEQLIHISPAEAFGIAADKIKQLGTQAEKTAAAYFLFGRAGSKMLNMLEVGSEGLRGFQNEVEKLGLTFSRLDAAQIEAANDALTRARAVLTGLFRQGTIELAPYIEVLADKFVEVATAGEGMGANVSKVFEIMSLGAVAFGSTIQMVGVRHEQLNAIVLSGMAKYFEVLEAIDFIPAFKGMEYLFKRQYGVGFGEFGAALRESATDWKEELADLEKETKQRSTAIEKFFNELRTKAAGRREELEAKAKARAEAGPAVPPDDDTKAVISADLKKMQALEATVDAEIKLLGRLDEPRQHARMLIQYEAAAMEEFAGNAQLAATATDKFRGKLEELEEAQKWAEVAKTMENSFAGALERLSQDWKNYGEIAKDVLREIYWEMMRIMFFRPVAQEMAGFLQTGISAIGSMLLGGGGMPTAGTVTPQAGATLAKYQYGDVATRPHLAMVGEVPEAIVPLSGGRSIPVEMRGGDAGGKIDVNINYTGRERHEVGVEQSVGAFKQQVLNITMEAMQHEPNYRRSIAQASRS